MEACAVAMASKLHHQASRSWWSASQMREWDELRTWVLTHPCPSEAELGRAERWRQYYARVPEGLDSYRFSRENDYVTKCRISLDMNDGQDLSREVSARAAMLETLSGVPEVSSCFLENGWKLTWEAKGYLMLAPVFTNIYLGAIGERAGKAILEARLPSLHLRGIDDPAKFEKFDFVVDGTDVYVDFKNWSVSSERKDDLDKNARKMETVEASCCAIVNLIAGDEFAGSSGDEVSPGVFAVPYLIDTEGMVAVERIIELRRWLRSKGAME